MSNKMTQRQRVLERLRNRGTLTTMEAVTEMGIMSLPKRIEELRKAGYPISMKWEQTPAGARYGIYMLDSKEA